MLNCGSLDHGRCGTTLASGARCEFGVYFTPSLEAAETATLNVNDGALGSPQTVALSGTGIADAFQLCFNGQDSYSFGLFALSQRSGTHRIQVMNCSNGPTITLNSIGFTGTNAKDFLITNTNCGTTLAANAKCQVTFALQPVEAGAFSATLTFVNTGMGGPLTFPVTGSETTADRSPISVNFGLVPVGQTSAPQNATFTNVGTSALNISSIALIGANAARFAETNNCPASLAAGASCTITVTFTPDFAGEIYQASVSITDNAYGSPQGIFLSGTGQ